MSDADLIEEFIQFNGYYRDSNDNDFTECGRDDLQEFIDRVRANDAMELGECNSAAAEVMANSPIEDDATPKKVMQIMNIIKSYDEGNTYLLKAAFDILETKEDDEKAGKQHL